MRLRYAFSLLVGFVVLLVAGCGADSGSCPASTALFGSDPVVVTDRSEIGGEKLLCNTEYQATDIALGTHVETTPQANYSLTETRGQDGPYPNVQISVSLHVEPPRGSVVPSAVVHTSGVKDRELAINAGNGGKVDMKLLTGNYAFLPGVNENAIGSITLCIKAAS